MANILDRTVWVSSLAPTSPRAHSADEPDLGLDDDEELDDEFDDEFDDDEDFDDEDEDDWEDEFEDEDLDALEDE